METAGSNTQSKWVIKKLIQSFPVLCEDVCLARQPSWLHFSDRGIHCKRRSEDDIFPFLLQKCFNIVRKRCEFRDEIFTYSVSDGLVHKHPLTIPTLSCDSSSCFRSLDSLSKVHIVLVLRLNKET